MKWEDDFASHSPGYPRQLVCIAKQARRPSVWTRATDRESSDRAVDQDRALPEAGPPVTAEVGSVHVGNVPDRGVNCQLPLPVARSAPGEE